LQAKCLFFIIPKRKPNKVWSKAYIILSIWHTCITYIKPYNESQNKCKIAVLWDIFRL
jgi:hypothetical protein